MGFLDTLVTMLTPQGSLQKSLSPMQTVPERQPKALLMDPLGIAYSMGYKDRRTNLSYEVLKRVAAQLSIVAAIINTRVNQVSTFTSPYRRTRTLGYEIRHKNREHRLTRGERDKIVELEGFISLCGVPVHNYYSPRPRDNFDQFTRKVIRDRLTYDALTFETVPNRAGDPFEFLAVDAATVRIAVDPSIKKKDLSKEEFSNIRPFLNSPDINLDFDLPRYEEGDRLEDSAAYVQIIHGSISRAFKYNELAYGIANPRTDILVNGYGYSELEQLIDTITSQLWAEAYNRNFFKQGAAPKGILNIRGDNIPQEQLEGFKRMWAANVSGVENAWRTPVMQSDEIQYLNLQNTNMEMEYSKWMEYLIRLICAVYLIATEEIGFSLTPGGMQQPMVETNNEWKLKASKDRGLRPLLRYYADTLNVNVIDRLDPRFYLDFMGLDELTERERIELRQQQVQYFRTINEVRKDEDLNPDPHGDIILNPAYLQWIQMQHQWKIEQEQRKQQNDMQERQMKLQEQQAQQQQQMQQQQMQQQREMQQQQVQAQQAQMQAQQQAQQQTEQQPTPQTNPQGPPEHPDTPISVDEIKDFFSKLPTDALRKLTE